MGRGTNYKQAKLGEQWDAIVIGSGLGGLSAAWLLAFYGKKRVLVLERHYEAGGFTHTFHRPGYEWDVGLHYIGEMQDKESGPRRAFDHLTGGAVQWAAMPEVYDRALIEGRSFDFTAGKERLREGLKESFPAEASAIDRYVAAVDACNRASGLYYAEKAIPGPAAALAGGLMRAGYMKWARRTTREVLENLTASRELMGVLTAQWGDYGMPPGTSSFAVHATIVAHYFAGASYPVGGASAIAEAMIPRIEENGSAVVTSAEVAEILVADGKAAGVRMADGREFRAGLVVSNSGAANTFERLVPAEVTAVDALRKELRKLPPSTAHISLYLGLDASSDELGLKGTNLWVYPSSDHDENVKRFARDLDGPFPVVYISFPSAKDPSFASRYPGKSTIEAITLVPYEAFARWGDTRWKRRGSDYDELKLRLTARLREEVERQVPAAVGRIAYTEISTPVTTRHFMNYRHGEIYGVSSSPERFLMRGLGARTPVKGLYLTGQDVASLGVMGAMFGGVICASAALGRNLMSTLSKPFVAQDV
jgi:all-trans-retinol 13,14-reductase